MTPTLDETRGQMWLLAASPAVWAAHLLLSYITAAVWCAKADTPDAALTTVRAAIGVYTIAALSAIAVFGWRGWKRHRFGDSTLPHDFDSPEDRHRFIGFATLLLSGLSAVAVLYAALAAALIERCR